MFLIWEATNYLAETVTHLPKSDFANKGLCIYSFLRTAA